MDRRIKIRQLYPEDAENFIELKEKLFSETNYMQMTVDEALTSSTEQKKLIETMSKEGMVIFVAQTDEQFVGMIMIKNLELLKQKHIAYIVMGILRNWWSNGIGKKLLSSCEKWCRTKGICRIELFVREDNYRAVDFYRQKGFVVEGVKKKSIFCGDQFYNELIMAKTPS